MIAENLFPIMRSLRRYLKVYTCKKGIINRKSLLLSLFVLPLSVLIVSCGSSDGNGGGNGGGSGGRNIPPEGCNSGNNTRNVQVPFTEVGFLSGLSDVDCYKITLTTSAFITASTNGSTDTVGYLYDSNGILIVGNDDILASGDFNFYLNRFLHSGNYYVIVVVSPDAIIGFSGSYILNIR